MKKTWLIDLVCLPIIFILIVVLMTVAARGAVPPDLDVLPRPVDLEAVVVVARSCPPCRRMEKELKGKKFDFLLRFLDSRADRTFKVKATPTTIKLRGGKEVDRKEGYMSAEALGAWMAK